MLCAVYRMATCLLLLLKEHSTPDVLTAQYSQTGKSAFSSEISISNVRNNNFLQSREHKMLSWETLEPGNASYIENLFSSVSFQHRILFFLHFFQSGMLLPQVSTMTKYLRVLLHTKERIKHIDYHSHTSFSYVDTPHFSFFLKKFSFVLIFSFFRHSHNLAPELRDLFASVSCN